MKDNYRSSIYSICKVRRECELPCRDCMYYGKECDEYKRHLQKLAERDNEIYMLTHYTKKGRRKKMKEFDKIILQGFYNYCMKNDIDPTDHLSLRLAGATYCHELQNIIINFIEWSIEDDRNNNTHSSAAVTAAEGSTHD